MNVGDSVYCIEDLHYFDNKRNKKTVKSGHTLLIKGVMGDKYILDRFGKSFVVEKEKLRKK
jgi:hypothetical protein